MVLPSDYLGRVLASSSLRLARLLSPRAPELIAPSSEELLPVQTGKPCSTYDVIPFYCRRLRGNLSPLPAVKVFWFFVGLSLQRFSIQQLIEHY